MREGYRLSQSMIPSMRITPIQHGTEYFWNIQIKCKFPEETSREQQRKLKNTAKEKRCNFRCTHVTDREGLNELIALIQDKLPHYEFKYARAHSSRTRI